jgi:hypothetical protein
LTRGERAFCGAVHYRDGVQKWGPRMGGKRRAAPVVHAMEERMSAERREPADAELAESIETMRGQLAQAKERVRTLYRDARIRLALNTGQWLVVDGHTGATLEASDSLDHLATGARATPFYPESGTHRRMDDSG